MRGAALEDDLEGMAGERCRIDPVLACGVEHERRVDAAEGTPVDHHRLPANRLLGRSPDDQHLAAQITNDPPDGRPGARRRGADQVVPAGMPYLRKGVVLGEKGDARTSWPASLPRDERRPEPRGAPAHGEALGAQEAHQERRCRGFLEAQLGAGEERSAERVDIRA